jgi:hypothetical protein
MAPVADPETTFGLGYRGVIVRQIKPDDRAWSKAKLPAGLSIPDDLAAATNGLPLEFRLGSRRVEGDQAADWLVTVAERKSLDIAEEVWEVLRQGVQLVPPPSETDARPPEDYYRGEDDVDVAPPGATWWACNSPFYVVNHDTFNHPDYVYRNNCYCFGSNHLANIRFARPGRRGGRPAPDPITGIGVVNGLRADGWIDGCQVNTLTIAVAVWPSTDYHFYRVVTGGPDWWWEHKPGGTPARWTDERNSPLFRGLAPVNCDRGPYRDFCGYFYQNNYTAYVA